MTISTTTRHDETYVRVSGPVIDTAVGDGTDLNTFRFTFSPSCVEMTLIDADGNAARTMLLSYADLLARLNPL